MHLVSRRRSLVHILLLLGLSIAPSSHAFRTTFEKRTVDIPSFIRPGLLPRDETSGNTTVGNVGNSQYVANITIGGANFNVILDTGSSDLWVAGNVPTSTDMNVQAAIGYAVGNAAGSIHTATVEFSEFTVSSQAYLQVNNTASFGSLSAVGINGLAGLGPGFSSVIRNKIGTQGDTLLDNIFQLNKTTSNYITFLLSRNGDIGEQVQGQFTISELVPGYESITSQPKLPVNELSNSTKINQHWTTYLDSIIGPDGKKLELDSIVDNTPDGKFVAVLDSGFTFPQVPRKLSDAIYGRVKGANYSVENGLWLIPCAQELNISFVLGGVTFPVHPLDTSSSDFGLKFSDGSQACAGTFQPISTAFSLGGEFDTILGEGFLRNTYTMMDWGDFVSETSAARGSPFIQLLSVTDRADAHHDFVQTRLNGVDTSGDDQYKLLSHGQSSPVSKGERVQHLEGFAYRNRVAIAIGTIVGATLILLGILFCCCRRRRRKDKGVMLPGGGYGAPGSYKTVDDPRSAPPNVPMNNMTGYRDPYYYAHESR